MFEANYHNLIHDILATGAMRETRNGRTLSSFAHTLKINDLYCGYFPLLTGRRMFYRGVFGELAAMLRRPTCVGDFVEQGCNYWGLWAEKDGSLNLDYGNSWFDFDGVDQIAALKKALKENPTDRRMIVTGWHPAHLEKLSLPCCHMLYQFYVDAGGFLHMLWIQRSADVMIGIPSDVAFAAAWLVAICEEFNLKPGTITMQFGDTHIYEEHIEDAKAYLLSPTSLAPTYTYVGEGDFCKFNPDDLHIQHYKHGPVINFKLKA